MKADFSAVYSGVCRCFLPVEGDSRPTDVIVRVLTGSSLYWSFPCTLFDTYERNYFKSSADTYRRQYMPWIIHTWYHCYTPCKLQVWQHIIDNWTYINLSSTVIYCISIILLHYFLLSFSNCNNTFLHKTLDTL